MVAGQLKKDYRLTLDEFRGDVVGAIKIM